MVCGADRPLAETAVEKTKKKKKKESFHAIAIYTLMPPWRDVQGSNSCKTPTTLNAIVQDVEIMTDYCVTNLGLTMHSYKFYPAFA